jgi:DNA gyrase subunit A
VVGIVPVNNDDQILLMTSRGKLQRLACRDIKSIGRNTQGVRIMRMDDGDFLAAVVKVPPGEEGETAAVESDPAESNPSENGGSEAGPATDE